MLPIATVLEIKRLIDEGQLSRRGIAKKLGVSRGTVNAIASGVRGLHGREKVDEPPEPPPQRCSGCGDLVRLPCVACRARDYRRRLREREGRAA